MRAGKLDSTITLQRSIAVIELDGSPAFKWVDLVEVRAEIIQSGTAEYIRAYGASDETATLFRIRYLHGITPADRVNLDGRIYEIVQVNEVRRRRGLEIQGKAS